MKRWHEKDSKEREVSRIVSQYDPNLFAERNSSGVVCVFEKVKRYTKAYDIEGMPVYDLAIFQELVFPLTDNWSLSGNPKEWNKDEIREKLQKSDFLKNEKLIDEMDALNEKKEEIREKDFRNETEAFVSDNKRGFQKVFSDINTSNLSKADHRKRIRDINLKRRSS